jgi:hypothetical protein
MYETFIEFSTQTDKNPSRNFIEMDEKWIQFTIEILMTRQAN